MTAEEWATKLEAKDEVCTIVVVIDNRELEELRLLVAGDVQPEKKPRCKG